MKKALLVVDIQNDFLPGGALGVTNGDQVIPIINKLMDQNFDLIVASKDWHPKNHGSFANTHRRKPGERISLKGLEQILWPVHCVQGSFGAEFSEALDVGKIDKVFMKGTDHEIDSYSAFYDNGHLKSTGLSEYFKEEGIKEVYIAGLTTDYCVKFSVLDAAQNGFHAFVIIDACKAVNLQKGDEKQAVEEMKNAGAKIITSEKLLKKKSG